MAAVALYGAAVVAAGLASTPQQLKAGEFKCFDDWCAGMLSVRPEDQAGRLVVAVRLENRARGRAMRSNLARAYVELPGGGQIRPDDARSLQTFIEAQGQADIALAFTLPKATRPARFVVTEGIDGLGPGTFIVGDEASPFHARAGWPL